VRKLVVWTQLCCLWSAIFTTIVGCAEPWWLNFIAPLQDSQGLTQVPITFFNETDFRVITYWGGYNPLAAGGLAGTATAQVPQVAQLVLEPGAEEEDMISCFRRIELAGPTLRRAVELGGPSDVDPDDINDKIGFSDLPADDPDALSPTAGFADPVRFQIGVDYACGDVIGIRFRQVAGEFVVEIGLAK